MKEETPEERLAKVIFAHPATNGAAPTAPEIAALCEDLAAVVLAHLTAEGWAQGREEWGLQYERGADPTMDNPSGVVTNTMTLRDESHARGVLDSPAPISARNKCVVRRRVTEWEPVDG